jgi:glycosyltransferase involved in cell wall biosynthesis
MKILFVIDTYQTNNNGTSISAQRFAAELRKRGHEVRILTTGEPSENIYALDVFRIPVFQGLIEKHGFQFASREADVVAEAVQWADVVHCFMPFALESYAKRMADRLGKPATAAFHIQPENITSSVNLGKVTWLTNAVYRGFRRRIYDRFTHVHTPSQFMADEITKRGYSAKIHVISNGIQDDFVWTKRPKMPEFQGKILIMMVGRLSVEKRQDVIINAVKHSKYADRIQLIFAGKGPKYEDYVELGRSLKNPPIFGYYNRQELINTLAQCDLYVHSSDMESEAISCIEAFATGLVPIIANSELSATPQFALDGRSLFTAGSPKDLARAIDYWLDNPAERARMERQYAEAAKRYNIDHSISQFEEMLHEAVTEFEPAELMYA